MDFTVELSKAFNISPFIILEEDKDKVIMFINYFIEKGETQDEKTTFKDSKREYDTPQKIKVTDATATGGWW